ESFIRILKLKDLIKLKEIKNQLTNGEFEKANSYKFPITILERLFSFTETKEKWGIDFHGVDILIKSNKDSFYKLFTELIKRIVSEDENKINTRITKEDLQDIFDSLPQVNFDDIDESTSFEANDNINDEDDGTKNNN